MKIRIIRINVVEQVVEEKYMEYNDYRDIYSVIGNECASFECPIDYVNGDTMYCDEEARLFESHAVGGFMYAGYQFPIINNAVIAGEWDEAHERPKDAKSTVEEISNGIMWLSKDEAVACLL